MVARVWPCSDCGFCAGLPFTAGGFFDPLGLASGDEEKVFKLKTAEIKHGRLAMVAFLGK